MGESSHPSTTGVGNTGEELLGDRPIGFDVLVLLTREPPELGKVAAQLGGSGAVGVVRPEKLGERLSRVRGA